MDFIVEELDPLHDFTEGGSGPHYLPPDETVQAQFRRFGNDNKHDYKCPVCETILFVLQAEVVKGMVALGSGTEVLLDNARCSSHQELVRSALRLDPSTIPTVARYIRVLEIHRSLGNKGAIVTASMYPVCPVSRPLLSSIYIVKERATADIPVAGLVLHPQWIDHSLPSLWKATCERLHNGLCKQHSDAVLSSTWPALIVDVIWQCIVIPPHNCSYVALSYVWGNQATLQSTRGNISNLQQPGSLSTGRSSIPIAKTIRDAMGISRLLGERYLWVDSLCIVQDDQIQKHCEIDKMAAIYANASGFRGISGPRNCSQNVHCLKGRAIVQHPIEGNYLELESSNSKWKTRAWTYQEQMFSRKRLVFNGDSIRWECAADIWREHVDIPSNAARQDDGADIDRSVFQRSVPDLSRLQNLVRGFNTRDFTYPEDALRASAGIFLSLSISFSGGFLSGLPVSLFDIALLWQPHDKTLRRTPKDPKNRFQLPSWSWAGWSGEIDFDSASALDFVRDHVDMVKKTRQRRIVRIRPWKFHETPQSPGEPILTAILDSKDMLFASRVDGLPGWSKHDVSESPNPFYEPPDPRTLPPTSFYRHDAYPGQEFWYPIPLLQKPVSSQVAPFISCRTRRTWLFASEEIPKNNGYRPVVSLRNKEGAWAGILQPHDGINTSGNGLQDSKSPLELVEIAQGFCRDTTSPWPGIEEVRHPERPSVGLWYEYYWVMWVGWIGKVAHRRGLGRVHKTIWEQDRGHEFDIMLG